MIKLAIGGISTLILFVLILLAFGTLDEFNFWVFEYPQKYLGNISMEQGLEYFNFHFDRIYGFQLYTSILSGFGLLASFFYLKKNPNFVILTWILLLFTFISIVPGYRFYGHYWLLPMIALSLLIGNLFGLVGTMEKLSKWKWTVALAFLLAMGVDIGNNTVYYFGKNPNVIAYSCYPGNPFPAHKVLAGILEKEMKKTDKLMVLGSEPQYYVYLDKKSPSRHIYHGVLMQPVPDNSIFQKETLNALKESRPEFVINNYVTYSWSMKEGSDRTLYNDGYVFIKSNYDQVAVIDYDKSITSNLYRGEQAKNYQIDKNKEHIVLYRIKGYR